MQRGKEMESEARSLYELITSVSVQQVGFCLNETPSCGASPDGLIEEEGSLEIKCPTIAVHVGYLLENILPVDYFQQTQGQLLVTGRRWVDFLSYYPGLKPFLIRVERNEKFIEALKAELIKFCAELEEISYKIR